MIPRRHFIGSCAAFCVASTSASRFVAAAASPIKGDQPLNWRCDVIQNIRHDYGTRAAIVTGVSMQPGGSQVAVVGDDHHVYVFDTNVQEFTTDLKDHTDWVRTTKFSPNGRLLATAGNDRMLRIWDTGRFEDRPSLHRHSEAVISLDFTSDSKLLATVGFGPDLRIFDIENNRMVNKLECECPDNHAVAFSRDDQFVAAGGRSGWIRVWDTKTGKLVKQFRPHTQRLRSLEFTADNRIVSCGDDQRVQISEFMNENRPITLPRHPAKLYDVAILDADMLAVSGSDNLIHIWKIAESEKLGTLSGHTGTVSCLDFSASRIASGAYDTKVRIWHERDSAEPVNRHTKRTDGWNDRTLK